MAFTFQHKTLPSGLTIVAETDPAAHTAAAGFFVKTGARDEASASMGVSHFLEHMMFKGTAGMSAEELNRAFDAVGARNNAFTSNEMTCFYAHALPEHTPICIELLGTMMRPALRAKDFDTEKGVILEEIAMYADNPFWILYERAVELHFGNHPLAHRVLGTSQTITDLQRDAMQAYFDRRYAADNTIVALAGNVDFSRSCDQIAALTASWGSTKPTRDAARPRLAGGEFTMRSPKANRGYVIGIVDAPAFDDDRRYAHSLLAQILGAHDNSRLHWSLVEPGMAESAQASYEPHDGYGEMFLFASGDPDKLEDIWSTSRAQLEGLRDSLTQADLDRLLNKFVTGMTVGGERPAARMDRLGRMFTYVTQYTPLEADLDRLARVTLAELRAACDAYPMRATTVGKLLPGGAG